MSGPVAKLTAEQAVAAVRRGPVLLGELIEALGALGITPEVAGAVASVSLTPERVEVEVALLAEPGAPRLTLSRPVWR